MRVKATCARSRAVRVKARIGLGLGIKQSNNRLFGSSTVWSSGCVVGYRADVPRTVV